MKHVVLTCLVLYIHTAQSEIFSQRSTEGHSVSLYCIHEGKVLWSKGRDGERFNILTAENTEEIQKHNPDPDNRYSVLGDLSLHIKKVSLSDSGIYSCNAKPAVNLTVTAAEKPKPTNSSNRHPGNTTTPSPDKQNSTTSSCNQTGSSTPAVTSTNILSSSVSTVTESNNAESTDTDPPNLTQVTSASTLSSGNPNGTDIRSQSNTYTKVTTATEKPKPTNSSNRHPGNTTTPSPEKPKSTKSSYSPPGNTTTPSPVSSSIAAAVSGAVVFVVLVLLLWACIKRNTISAALSNKNENIYETVDDGDPTAQPVPSQKPNDIIYYLAGDPDIVKLGQRPDTDDHTYTLISESQSKENITGQTPETDDQTYTLISDVQSKNITGQRLEIDDPTYSLILG